MSNEDKKDDKDITVTIQSPRGSKELTFDKNAKVSEVIEAARTKFGFEPGVFVLKHGTTVLALERPLVSYQIKDGDVLLLVPEMGSGV